MMNPDQIYALRQLRHQDLQLEVERARATRELVGNRTAWGRFVAWLRSVGMRRTRGVTPTGQVEQSTPTTTA
jgi:hypothetical protein